MNKLILLVPLLLQFVVKVFADDVYYCNATVSCPESLPCCGAAAGICGTGAYCLACDPRYSFNLTACMPSPICQDSHNELTVSSLADFNSYLGNASEADWLYTGYVMDYDEGLILAMPNQTTGTVLYSTRYMWYGKTTARFRSSRGQGVVSAFILYSDVQDEVDFEFVGADLFKVQTNFYYEGILNYTNSRNITTNNTYENFHEISMEWTEDEINWSVDGVIGRTLRREDTYNATSGDYMFPQTPSRVQLSLWPGGAHDNAIGTINWAGGMIDWDAPDFEDPGYLYAILDSIEIECYDPPAGTKITGDQVYIFNSSTDFSKRSIEITDDRTYLANLLSTGFDRDYGVEDEEDEEDEDQETTAEPETSLATSHSFTTTDDNGQTTTQVSTSVPTTTTNPALTFTGFVQDTQLTSVSTGGAIEIKPPTFMLVSLIALTSWFF